jgi:hypothetical protein
MEKLKKFDEIFESKFFRGVTKTTITLNSVLRSLFSLFKSKTELKKIWNEGTKLKIATDIYDELVDSEQISKLPIDEQQIFADNLGVGSEDNLLSAIVKKSYQDKHNRDFVVDLYDTIKSLEDILEDRKDDRSFINLGNYGLCEEYLEQIKKLKTVFI